MSRVLSVETSVQMSKHWNTIDEVERDLWDLGFVPFPRPEFAVPAVTAELLTTLDDKEYTQRYAEVHQWHAHAVTHMARIRARLLQVQNNMKHMEAAIRVTKAEEAKALEEKKPTVQDQKDSIQLESDYVQLQMQEQVALQKKIYMEPFVDVLERATKLFSRQVEIRRQEKEQNRVEEALPSRGYRYNRNRG